MLRLSKGVGLVEIMVGLLIGMITVLVIMQVLATSEGQKRTTTHGNEEDRNAAFSMYTFERELRVAGHGLTNPNGQIGCLTLTYDTQATPVLASPTPRLAPILITDGGASGISDMITVTFGTGIVTSPYVLPSGATADNDILLDSTAGLKIGDVVQISQKVLPGATPTLPCTLAQITDIPAGAPTTIRRIAGAAGSICPNPSNPTSACAGSRYNRVGGLGTNYEAGAALFNLGRLVSNTYTVNFAGSNSTAGSANVGIWVNSSVTGATSTNTLFAPDIVNIQAQYGIDSTNANTGTIDSWVEPTGNWANVYPNTPSIANLSQIRAIRIALLARNGQPEKPDASGACTVTTAAPTVTWNTTPAGPAMNFNLASLGSSWGCYRYKVYQTIVPVKNMITIWQVPEKYR